MYSYAQLGMVDTDVLSAATLAVETERRAELAEAQDEDEILREVKEFVRRRKAPPSTFPESFYCRNFKRLVIQGNVLCRKAHNGPSQTPILQAMIPPKLVPQMLQDAHGDIFAGHPGHAKMVSILERHVTWPGLYVDTRDHVGNCLQCDINHTPNPPP